MSERITILLADDHPMFRSGVKHELEQNSRFEIIAETGNGAEALIMIKKMNPDVAVLDIQMPELTGLDIAKNIYNSGYKTNLVLLTMYDDQSFFSTAMEWGVIGYVLKNDAVQDIVEAVHCAANGRHFISPALSIQYISENNHVKDDAHLRTLIETLSGTERKILALIADLRMNDEIAEILYISKRTVENSKTLMAQKLGLCNAKQLLRFAAEHKELL